MNVHVVLAIFRRNFVSYFSTPTGYVFIFVFVLLSSLAAFWPNEFFVNNLANLDQLNRFLPFILLVFVPAITMGIWAEERRQGTDELLLTIPATDLDVVTGKLLSGVAIYSVALAFSALCNFIVLNWLGNPDWGLFLATYVGYWLMGLTMISVGMVGSFLTGNVTIAFVLGALFNLPLAALVFADVIMPTAWALDAGWWSLSEQFRDLGRGVISLPSVVYFFGLAAVMLYVSMILMGRRHWAGGRESAEWSGHFTIRALALLLFVGSLIVLCDRSGVRADITAEKISSLSDQTRQLVRGLEPKHPIHIDAYISPEVPESYVQIRLNILSTLRELKALGGDKFRVQIHETPPLSPASEQAEKLHGITAREVFTRSRSATTRDEIYLGVAFSSGLEKVLVPFFEFGTPVEYEMIRSIATVANEKRKIVGVLQTDARLFGGFDPQTMSQSQDQLLIEELRKQYEVKQVNPATPITEKFDVLLAVQPSSLGPAEMDNFIDAVEAGQPTAIFEDPFCFLNAGIPGTTQPKQSPGGMGGMFGGQQPPAPKGNIGRLWNLLGVDFMGNQVIAQSYNPYPRFPFFPEFVFVDNGYSRQDVFNRHNEISRDMQQLLFLFPGAITPLNSSSLKFSPLVTTGDLTGTVNVDDVLRPAFFGQGGGLNPARRTIRTNNKYTFAAQVSGKPKKDLFMADQEAAPPTNTAEAAVPPATNQEQELNVVLVSDIDCLFSDFFMLRQQTGNPDRADFNLMLDNVTFVLNTLDTLAGDDRFIAIRGRRPQHRTLTKVELVTEKSRREANEQVDKFKDQLDKNAEQVKKQLQDKIDELQKRKDQVDPVEFMQQLSIMQRDLDRKLAVADERTRKEFNEKRKSIERDLAIELAGVHRFYKLWAVLLPPVFPLLVGLGVFFSRRAREREGVSRSRLR